MSVTTASSLVFLNLEPFASEAKRRLPKAHKALFAQATPVELRRRAFFELLHGIEEDLIKTSPAAAAISGRRRATLAFYALLDGSPMATCPDAEVERLLRMLLPTPSAATAAVATAGQAVAI